jgi:hypothetical protein
MICLGTPSELGVFQTALPRSSFRSKILSCLPCRPRPPGVNETSSTAPRRICLDGCHQLHTILETTITSDYFCVMYEREAGITAKLRSVYSLRGSMSCLARFVRSVSVADKRVTFYTAISTTARMGWIVVIWCPSKPSRSPGLYTLSALGSAHSGSLIINARKPSFVTYDSPMPHCVDSVPAMGCLHLCILLLELFVHVEVVIDRTERSVHVLFIDLAHAHRRGQLVPDSPKRTTDEEFQKPVHVVDVSGRGKLADIVVSGCRSTDIQVLETETWSGVTEAAKPGRHGQTDWVGLNDEKGWRIS